MQFQPSKQYEGIRRRRGAVTSLRFPYGQMPGQLNLLPIAAYGGAEDEIVFLPSTPTQEAVPSGGGSTFDPSAWVSLGTGLVGLIGNIWPKKEAPKQQVVYVPQPAAAGTNWTAIGLVGLLVVGGVAGAYLIMKEE